MNYLSRFKRVICFPPVTKHLQRAAEYRTQLKLRQTCKHNPLSVEINTFKI